jgi:hypothetical protein
LIVKRYTSAKDFRAYITTNPEHYSSGCTTQLNHGPLSVDFATLVLGSDGELYKMVPVLVSLDDGLTVGMDLICKDEA